MAIIDWCNMDVSDKKYPKVIILSSPLDLLRKYIG